MPGGYTLHTKDLAVAGRIKKEVSVAIGNQAGQTNQGANSVAIGPEAGKTNQDVSSVAIGRFAGFTGQRYESVAVGTSAGQENQRNFSVSVGNGAGQFSQNTQSVAVGSYAGNQNQGSNCVAIGSYAGYTDQGPKSVAIGHRAGFVQQGSYSIAIGNESNASSGSIVLNASSSALHGSVQNATYINPIRDTRVIASNVLSYGTTEKEVINTGLIRFENNNIFLSITADSASVPTGALFIDASGNVRVKQIGNYD
jgi:hypothetical protein